MSTGGVYIGAPGTVGAAIARDDRLRAEQEAARRTQIGNAASLSYLRSAMLEGTPATKQYEVNGRSVGQNRAAVAPSVDPLAMFKHFAGGGSPLMNVAAQQAISQLFPQQITGKDRYLDTPNGVFDVVSQKIVQDTAPAKGPTDIERRAVAAGFTPGTSQFQEFIRNATLRPNSVTNVNMPDAKGDVKYMEEMGKLLAEDFAGLQKAGSAAQASLQKFDRLGGLLDNVNSGAFKGTTTQLKAIAKSAGVDLDSMGIADDVAPAQAARAITNEIALQLRNPAGGAGMPGALSDKDREYLLAMVPSLETTPEGNKLLVDYWRRINKRNIEIARMARDYMKKNDGRFDYGFYDELEKYSARNSLFPEAAEMESDAATPGAVDYEYVPGRGLVRVGK